MRRLFNGSIPHLEGVGYFTTTPLRRGILYYRTLLLVFGFVGFTWLGVLVFTPLLLLLVGFVVLVGLLRSASDGAFVLRFLALTVSARLCGREFVRLVRLVWAMAAAVIIPSAATIKSIFFIFNRCLDSISLTAIKTPPLTNTES